ncbi:MAG: glycosyltransferase family 4 protein [Thermosphaera sp.]
MNILILSEAFPPETKSASTLIFELAQSLVQNGHFVSVVTRMPRYNVASGTQLAEIPARETMFGIKVYRFQTPPLARDIPFIRGLEHFLLGLIFFWGGLFLGKFDIVLVYSPPLPLGISGYWLSRIKDCPVVVNIQDLYPQTVIDLGLLKNPFLIWISRMMEKFIYHRADALTVHSEGNKKYVIEMGAGQEKTTVIHNWVDTDFIRPAGKENDFSRKYNLVNKFVVSFAGVMGFAQGLDVVIEAAELLQEKDDIIFVLVGDGVKKLELENKVRNKGLQNVLFVPTVPLKEYPNILHASDVCLVTLRHDLLTPVVPGKILSIMAAGKPILASLPLFGDAPKIIREFGCGLVVEPSNPRLLAEAVLEMYNNNALREEMGKRGRQAAVQYFSRSICVDKYEYLFGSLQRRK